MYLCCCQNGAMAAHLNNNNDGRVATGLRLKVQISHPVPLAQDFPVFGDVGIGQRVARVFAPCDAGRTLGFNAQHMDQHTCVTRRSGGPNPHHVTVPLGVERHRRGQSAVIRNRLGQFHRPRAHNIGGPVDDHLWRVNRPPSRLHRIATLAIGIGRVRKLVLPADVIPIIHVQGQRDHVVPLGQFMHQLVRRRAR